MYQTHHSAPAEVIPMAQVPADVLAWIAGAASKSDFAKSLQKFSIRRKGLTPGQIDAAKKCAAPKAPPVTAGVNDLGVAAVKKAFDAALENGIKRPKLRIDSFILKPAKASSANAGALYVTLASNDEYLGKISAGQFVKAKACTTEQLAAIVAACKSPLEAAVAYGKATGICACCGRELTDPVSIEQGVGPICASKWFGG